MTPLATTQTCESIISEVEFMTLDPYAGSNSYYFFPLRVSYLRSFAYI